MLMLCSLCKPVRNKEGKKHFDGMVGQLEEQMYSSKCLQIYAECKALSDKLS